MRFVVGGLFQGGVLALATIGFSFFWSISGVFNLAQGAFMLLGAYSTWWLSSVVHIPLVIAAIFSLAIVFGLGYLFQNVLISKLDSPPSFLVLLLTFGTGLGISSILAVLFTSDYRSISSPIGAALITIGSVSVSVSNLVATLLAILLVIGLLHIFRNNRFGLAIRAIGNNVRVAELSGLPVRRYLAITSGISVVFAALAGIFLGLSGAFSTSNFNEFTLLVSVASVLGGYGKLRGALLASIGLGALEGVTTQYFPSNLVDVPVLFLLLLALTLRSERLFANVPGPKVDGA